MLLWSVQVEQKKKNQEALQVILQYYLYQSTMFSSNLLAYKYILVCTPDGNTDGKRQRVYKSSTATLM